MIDQMTRQQLKVSILFVIAYISLLILAAGISKRWQPSAEVYNFVKEMSSLLIALPAAYLTYCLQRRQTHLAALRDLWNEVVDAKGELIQYTHLEAPSKEEFAKAHKSISKAIDSVRAVYRNFGESDAKLGLYPFEPLHDMRRALDILNPTIPLAADARKTVRKRVVDGWNTFRWALLDEFQTPDAPRPVTEANALDPRRRGSGSSWAVPK